MLRQKRLYFLRKKHHLSIIDQLNLVRIWIFSHSTFKFNISSDRPNNLRRTSYFDINFIIRLLMYTLINMSLWQWHTETLLKRPWDIVDLIQVFNRRRSRKLLSASTDARGQIRNRVTNFSYFWRKRCNYRHSLRQLSNSVGLFVLKHWELQFKFCVIELLVSRQERSTDLTRKQKCFQAYYMLLRLYYLKICPLNLPWQSKMLTNSKNINIICSPWSL